MIKNCKSFIGEYESIPGHERFIKEVLFHHEHWDGMANEEALLVLEYEKGRKLDTDIAGVLIGIIEMEKS